MLRLATAATLLSLLLGITSALAWEVDPTKGVVPLDLAAELYRLDENEAALDYLEDKLADCQARYTALLAYPDSAEEGVFDSADRSLLRFNYTIAAHLWCIIKSDWHEYSDPLVDCSKPRTITLYEWAIQPAFDYANMFIIEEFDDTRLSVGSLGWTNAVFSFGNIDEDSPRLEAICGVFFVLARFFDARYVQELLREDKLLGVQQHLEYSLDSARFPVPEHVHDSLVTESRVKEACVWHYSHLDQIGPVLASQAIFASMEGDDKLALGAGLRALESDAQMVFDDDYSYPLFWTLAASHRLKANDGSHDLAELARSLRDKFNPELHPALDLYIDGPPTDDTSPDCSSAGCHYFAAQYFEGIGDRDAAARQLEAGASQCVDTTSIPCTAISVALDRSDAATEP